MKLNAWKEPFLCRRWKLILVENQDIAQVYKEVAFLKAVLGKDHHEIVKILNLIQISKISNRHQSSIIIHFE